MNSNGTGLVLASVALADRPRMMLPIIAYNLVQHLVAGATAFLLQRSEKAAALAERAGDLGVSLRRFT